MEKPTNKAAEGQPSQKSPVAGNRESGFENDSDFTLGNNPAENSKKQAENPDKQDTKLKAQGDNADVYQEKAVQGNNPDAAKKHKRSDDTDENAGIPII
jgi:hypothetical protein